MFFLLEKINWPPFSGVVDAAVGNLVSPGGGLEVTVSDGLEGSTREEVFLDVSDCPFNASFFMRTPYITGRSIKEIVIRKIHKAWIELDFRTDPAQDDTLQIVIPDFFGDTFKKAPIHHQKK